MSTSPSQNFIFRLHKSGESNVQLECWQKSKKITDKALSSVKDSIKTGSGKIATSVPSPFARMHLFETAFNIVAENDVLFKGTSLYHQLVSDCLDMFQLIFEHGGNKGLVTIEEWNKTSRLEALRKHGPSHPHHLLAETLDMFINKDATGSMAGMDSIYLIKYKNVLVGGTSPLTVFFTGANWHRMMKSNYFKLTTTTEDVLFDDDYAALYERDSDFIEFMVKFSLAYANTLQQKCAGLEKYIRLIVETHLPDIQRKIESEWSHYRNNPGALGADYKSVNTDGTNTQFRVGGMTLYCQKEGGFYDSDFTIQATVNHYQYEPNSTSKLNAPLVLVDGMDMPLKYLRAVWDKNTRVPYQGGVPLSKRVLPNSDITYPYLTTDDFLADRLVKLPFKVNKEAFVINCGGDFSYLLPVKREYFKFFTVKDLEKHLRIDTDPNGAITVSLNVPIKHNRVINFSKRFEANHELVAEARVGLGIFPFYRITNCDENVRDLHDYSVFLADKTEGSDVELRFMNFNSIDPQANNYDGYVENVKAAKRTLKGTLPGSIYHQVSAEFDAIELSFSNNGTKYIGLIVPKFKEVNYTSENSGKFTFAIDFGTSNTHIAFTGPQNNIPLPFNIGEADKQMVLLSEPNRSKNGSERYQRISGSLPQIETLLKREFVPNLIGTEHDSNITFPIRTATCELGSFDSQGENDLFGSLNIGFSIDEEDDVAPGVVYTTNLKLLYEKRNNPKDTDRLRLFFKELLWMIKNKVILNRGKLSELRILWLIPESILPRNYSRMWTQAANEVFKSFDNAFEVNPIIESIAPYFFLRQSPTVGAGISAEAINIDIGGGTTDVMYVAPSEKSISISFRFAGNDIWGEGVFGGNSKDNGFISNFLKIYQNSSTDKDRPEDGYLQKSLGDPNLGSEDVIALLFKYDKHFKFIDSIHRGNPNMLLILFLHYGALIYHLVQIFNNEGIRIPRYFMYSGKGSQYIDLMCGKSDIAKFTKLLLNAFSDEEIPGKFDVILVQEPKQATANGAILYDKASGSSKETFADDKRVKAIHYGQMPDCPIILDSPKYNELNQEFLDSVVDSANDFVQRMLSDKDISLYLNSHGINRTPEVLRYITEDNATELRDSMKAYMQDKRNSEEPIQETLFFLSLKNMLFNVGKKLVQD
jgi:hypothetical protein